MLLKAGAAMLLAWLLGLSGFLETDSRMHVFLLVGLLLLLIGVLRARDAAAGRHKTNGRP